MDLKIQFCDERESVEYEDVRFEQDKNFDWIQSLKLTDGKQLAPIDICYKEAKSVKLFNLEWIHYEIPPTKMKLTNTGNSLILSGKWFGDYPYLNNGPLKGNYVFSQLHFIWGNSTLEGSEHALDGMRQPLEVHSIHFNENYYTQDRALKRPGGVMIIVYLYEIRFHKNIVFDKILNGITAIREANTMTNIEPFPLKDLICPFRSDYFVYWGTLRSAGCEHIVQWLIPRKVHSISFEQVQKLKLLMNPNLLPIKKVWRRVQPKTPQTIFLVNSSTRIVATTWLQIPLSKQQECIRLVSTRFVQ